MKRLNEAVGLLRDLRNTGIGGDIGYEPWDVACGETDAYLDRHAALQQPVDPAWLREVLGANYPRPSNEWQVKSQEGIEFVIDLRRCLQGWKLFVVLGNQAFRSITNPTRAEFCDVCKALGIELRAGEGTK